MRKLLLLLLMAGCSTQEYTWGAAYYDISGAWCERMYQCGFLGDQESCWRHAYFHQCEVPGSACGVILPYGAEYEADVCVEATLVDDCDPALFWGELPVECSAIIGRKP